MLISNMYLEYFVQNYTVNLNNAVKSACNKSYASILWQRVAIFRSSAEVQCIIYATTTPRTYYILCVLRCITVLVVRAKIVFDR